MTWWGWLLIAFYAWGWITSIFLTEPHDVFEGGVAILTGLIWPLFLLAYLVSRPFSLD